MIMDTTLLGRLHNDSVWRFPHEGVKIGDITMTIRIERTKVAVVFSLLLATIVLGQITSNSGFAQAHYEVTDYGTISQTYTDHSAIFTDGNADFLSQAAANSWTGTGLEGNPIVIEGYRITDSTTEGIKIWNVDLHWVVRDCVIEGGGPTYACGFYIDNCSNGEFSSNIIQNRDVGIQAYEGTNNCNFLNNQILNRSSRCYGTCF